MWCVTLSASQRDALRDLVASQTESTPSLQAALEALDFARWDDLPEASLPWDSVAELARVQRIDEADVVWDLTSGMHAPEAKGSAPQRAARKAARR
ncbi:MAG TPA: hypothetical protein VEQ61_06100 [Thermoleophilaceae bacterium]|nr:hypothetical protein [Thermoleophilaceae bacterium]